MYELIADQYSKLFPPDGDRCSFILNEVKHTPNSPRSILDAGCANGDLAFELAAAGCRLTGIDLDPMMIKIAKEKARNIENAPVFQTRSLTDIENLGQFDSVISFGNTLPHLSSDAEVLNFFMQASGVLKSEGKLIFQIINFEQLEDRDEFDFPDIITDETIFRRRYKKRADGRFDFIISIEEKSSGKLHSDSTPLMPLKRGKLLTMLEAADFSNIKIYADYKKSKADGMEYSSIYCATGTSFFDKNNFTSPA